LDRQAKKVVLASSNTGKIREIQAIVKPVGIDLLSMADFDVPPVDEPYDTFVENALAKARAVAAHTKLPALADDSGLCVEALGYQPGVKSARFAGDYATDQQNNQKLLSLLQNQKNSRAFFYCNLVMVQSEEDPQPLIADGRWFGQIAYLPAGDNGFGYDPVFYPDGQQITSAQLTPEQKNQMSHRAIALRELIRKLTINA
jgi:XTP/dITP diphosphohydrolase